MAAGVDLDGVVAFGCEVWDCWGVLARARMLKERISWSSFGWNMIRVLDGLGDFMGYLDEKVLGCTEKIGDYVGS